MAGDRTDDRKSRSSVAAGQLHDRLAGPQRAVGLGIFDDLTRDAILLGITRVKVLELGEDTAPPVRQPRQLDEGYMADGRDGGRQHIQEDSQASGTRLALSSHMG